VREHLDGLNPDADTETFGAPTSYTDVIPEAPMLTGYGEPAYGGPGFDEPGFDEPLPDGLALVDELFAADDEPFTEFVPVTRLRRGFARALMITGGALGALLLLYAADMVISADKVPRGVTVAGIDVGGLTRQDAEAKLRQQLEPRLTQPVAIHAGDVQARLNPTTSGLGLDWPATLDQAGHQSLNPIERVTSFFTSHEVGVVTSTSPNVLTQAVKTLADTQLDHQSTEGNIAFRALPGDGLVRPYAVEPRQGQVLQDVGAAVQALTAGWLSSGGVTLRLSITPVKATSAGVQSALDDIVAPAVAGPVTLHGKGKDTVLKPAAIADSFQFAPQDDGQLQVRIDQQKLQLAVQQDLNPTELPSKDAQIVFTGGQPTVQPSVDARKINWPNTFLPLVDVLKKSSGRDLNVAYDATKPSVTTEAANALGIKEVVGEYTATGLSGDAETNNSTLAAAVSGAIVKPGGTFSLDARSGAFSEAQGYVPAPLYEDGSGPTLIGGGISALASALYNAEYLAGLKDVDHAEHAYYLDRYPVARDAKAMESSGTPVDLKFLDDAPTGVALEASVSGGSVTVKIWGTRRFQVASLSGGESNLISPTVQFGSGPTCVPSDGAWGFSTSDQRVLSDLGGTEVRRETHSATYAPKPITLCA
jgi:vancomycin resistance protein YoaR